MFLLISIIYKCKETNEIFISYDTFTKFQPSFNRNPASVGSHLDLFFVPGASFTGSDPTTAFALLSLACGCNGFIYSGEQSAMLDIANNVN